MGTLFPLKRCLQHKAFVLSSALLFVLTASSYSQGNRYPVVRTSQDVVVNRQLPANRLADDEAIPVRFSKSPTDDEIYAVHFFEEPLVPSNEMAAERENSDLVYALIAYSQRRNPDDFTSLTDFLKSHPRSRWQGALLANLGIVYRRTGYYSMALSAWNRSWNLLKNSNNQKAKVLADRVVSELLFINAWVGRVDTLEALLNQVKTRTMNGPASDRIAAAKEGLYIMKQRPEISYRCGPYALNKLYSLSDSSKKFNEELAKARSKPTGFSLSELRTIAAKVGMKYQMAYRSVGAPVILNSVVHWKLNHYSALLKQKNGYLLCEDATTGTVYGKEFSLTLASLDSSASGYFLVPEGPLPAGWRVVNPEEGNNVFGKGGSLPNNKDVSPGDKQLPEPPQCPSPMAQSNVHASAVSLHIFDRPVYYTPPKGPAMDFMVDYHHKDSYQPSNFAYSNLGPKWTFNWLSYVQDDPNSPSANADVYMMGGGDKTFVYFDDATQSYAPQLTTNDVLMRVCPTCYELRHPDGSKEVYARPDGNTSAGRKIFLTKKVDAAGNTLTLTYDANLRVTSLKDALGQVTTIKYENADIYKITKVTDPFGRSASFQYDGSGRLSKITDMIGIVSSFVYDGGEFINQMNTPYGATKFVYEEGTDAHRTLETQFSLGEKEKVEYIVTTDVVPMSEVTTPTDMDIWNNWLVYRNTYYWDKKAMRVAPDDHTKAHIYHWHHGDYLTGENGVASPLLESEKAPLENRVWYNYQNQYAVYSANQGMSAKPSKIGRVLDDGTTQLYQYTYNDLGGVTSSVDPSGRKFSYVYDSTNINMLEVRQTKGSANVLLSKFTYNAQHLPLTYKNASGLTTYYTYNAAGQLLTVKNPKNEIVTLTYDSKGYLTGIAGPVAGATVSFGYDGFGRVRTVTNSQGYKITTDYDVLDRPTLITYPDSSYEQIVYDKLDAVHRRDRMGRWSHTIYDSLRRASAFVDALGRVTQFMWCSCGSLSEIVDPLKNITTFTRDLQGRLLRKTYPDGKSTNYVYEATTSRLKEVTDAKGQKTSYAYFTDDNLKSIAYANATISTPGVSFTYDDTYDRMATMTDGTGKTTYGYKAPNSGLGSLQLSSVDGPLSNDVIAYGYDSLGRINKRSINSVALSLIYDKLGRVSSETNSLGTFGYNYVNQTAMLASMTYPNGQSVVYDYFDNKGDQRLKQIWNRKPDGGTLSKFGYEYNKEGNITKWTQQSDSLNAGFYELGYDLADQLISATLRNQNTTAVVKRYAYQYDKAGNRTSEQIDNAVTSAVHNNLNQLVRRQDGGPFRIKGTVNEFSSVQVSNASTADSLYAPVDSTTNSFEAFVKTAPGPNNITISATDYSGNGNKTVNSYNITTAHGVNDTLAFDANGNTVTQTSSSVKYGWDAADRLVKITKGNNVTEFVYDGLSRRVAEKLNGIVIKRWLWDGTEMAEERDAAGSAVTKRFFGQGEQIGGTNYYFTRDHLGSVIELTDASGILKTRYSYDPYGRRSKIFGNVESDFGFTGHYFHTVSGLHLTLYRAYDANVGRWLNRDPIYEYGGLNLYDYVKGNPIRYIDRYGRNAIAAPIILGGLILTTVIITSPPFQDAWKNFVNSLNNLLNQNNSSEDDKTPSKPSDEPEPKQCPGKIPWTGVPGSTAVGPGQSRKYGDDGYPEIDRDAPHPDHSAPGNGDHSHDWGRPADGSPPTNSNRGPGRLPKPGDPPPPRGYNVPTPKE